MIAEDIQTYTSKLDVKFARNNVVKMLQTLKRVRKFIADEMAGYSNVQFTSQDLRAWTIKVEKVLKAVNKKISFTEYYKGFYKYERVNRDVLMNEVNSIKEYIRLGQDLEFIYSNLCNLSTILLLIETDIRQTKDKSDKMLEKAILEAIEDVRQVQTA